MVTYSSTLDINTTTVEFLSAKIENIRYVHRKLSAFEQALVTLVYLRKGDTLHALAGAYRVSVSTVHRYIHEEIELLGSGLPMLETAVNTSPGSGGVLLLDDSLIRSEHCASHIPTKHTNYSGKHKRHGFNIQALTTSTGRIVWLSDPLPGPAHDITAARAHGIFDATSDRIILADKGYQGAPPHVITPIKGHNLHPANITVNRENSRLQARCERALAVLKNWKILQRIRTGQHQLNRYLKAI